jgi:hypothetical protein
LIRVPSSNGSYELSQRHDRTDTEWELIFGDRSFQIVKSASVVPTMRRNAEAVGDRRADTETSPLETLVLRMLARLLTLSAAPLQVRGSIANIMASMEVIDLLKQRFLAAAQNDPMAKIASAEIDTETKQQKAPRHLRGGAFEQISRVGEFASVVGCGGLMAQRLVNLSVLIGSKPMPHFEIDVWNPGS